MTDRPHLLASGAAPAPAPKGEPRPWWESRPFVAAMILIAFVPLLYPPVPPLVDLLGHMGRYRVELDLANSPDLQRYYNFQWQLIGNLGVDLLIVPLSKVFGLELAVKLIVMAIPPLTVAGFLWVAREVHNRLPPTVLFALPFAFGHPFLFGFVNYALSMALAFLAFGLWLRLGRLGRTGLRALLFVPISFLLFITHTFGWGTLGLLAFSAEAVRQHDRGIGWWRSGLRAALHASVMAGPLLLVLLWRSGVSHGMTSDYFNLPAKLLWLVMALRDRWQWLDMMSVAVALTMLIFAWRRSELTLSRNLAFSALVLFAFFLILPRIVFGSAYADMRLVPFVIATALLGIRFKDSTDFRLARNLALIGLAFYLGRIAATTCQPRDRIQQPVGPARCARPCPARGAAGASGERGLHEPVGLAAQHPFGRDGNRSPPCFLQRPMGHRGGQPAVGKLCRGGPIPVGSIADRPPRGMRQSRCQAGRESARRNSGRRFRLCVDHRPAAATGGHTGGVRPHLARGRQPALC